MSRFDYVKYDTGAIEDQALAKKLVEQLEGFIESIGYAVGSEKYGSIARSKSLALTKLEEAYMWIGKAIRDDQLARNNISEPQEERNDA